MGLYMLTTVEIALLYFIQEKSTGFISLQITVKKETINPGFSLRNPWHLEGSSDSVFLGALC